MGALLSYFFKKTDVTEAAKDELNDVFEKLSKSGVMKKTGTGFTFIDVDDKYVTEGVKILRKYGFGAPPYFGRGLVGAHITVMDEEEAKDVDDRTILGKEVNFAVEGFNIVKPRGVWAESELFLVIVKADILDDIREEAGVEKKKHPFHITIGTRYT